MGSMDTLVDDLLRKPQDSFRDELLRKALAGRYHDYKSDVATPKLELVTDLTRFGYRDLARKAKSGGYDDEPDGADEADLGDFLSKNPELAEWDRKVRAGEVTYEEAVLATMKTLTPEEQILAAVEIDITRSEKPRSR